MEFKDHFSRQSNMYLKGRPHYPEELFEYLAGIAPARDLCWDCATGNGQAAISLAKYFKQVTATDGSGKQIENALKAPNIQYKVALAEESGLPSQCTDLITVATAAHWFNHDRFYAEAQRVSKKNGILAVWTYSEAHINTEIDKLMLWFMYDFLYAYWPDSRWYVRSKYETLPFPFKTMQTPEFYCNVQWDKAQWLNYIRSWSAYDNYIAKKASDPLELLMPELNKLWLDAEIKPVTWPLHLKCARLN